MHAIKWRERRGRPWFYLTPDGRGSQTSGNARQYPNEVAADRARERLTRDNPGMDFRVVDLELER